MPRHLTFPQTCLSQASEHKELWPWTYNWDALKHLSSLGVLSTLGNHKDHISPDTGHILKTILKLTQRSVAWIF